MSAKNFVDPTENGKGAAAPRTAAPPTPWGTSLFVELRRDYPDLTAATVVHALDEAFRRAQQITVGPRVDLGAVARLARLRLDADRERLAGAGGG